MERLIDRVLSAGIWVTGIGMALLFASGLYALTNLPAAETVRALWR